MTHTTRAAHIWIILAISLGFAGGAVAGGAFINDRWQHYYADRAAHDAKQAAQDEDLGRARDRGIEMMRGTIEALTAQVAACQQNFTSGTVLYETPPGAAVASGVRALLGQAVNMTPGANVSPRWWIPARIKPQVYGGAQGAVYYYVSGDGRADGPYLPAAAGAQQ